MQSNSKYSDDIGAFGHLSTQQPDECVQQTKSLIASSQCVEILWPFAPAMKKKMFVKARYVPLLSNHASYGMT